MPKILIADDDRIARKLYQRGLESAGHTIIAASNGRRAWNVLQDNPDIEVLVTDYQMPDLDGRELASMIHEQMPRRQLPVVMISGHISVEEVRDLLGIGIARFLDKPVDTQRLVGYVNDLLAPPLLANSG